MTCLSLRGAAMTLVLVTAGCSGEDFPRTSPSPLPTATRYTLTGIVTLGPTLTGISGATVRVVDGPNAGLQATTSDDGAYVLPGLIFSGFTVSAGAPNYTSTSRGIALQAGVPTKTESFAILPDAPWTLSGVGNTMFDMPTYIRRVRITGTLTGFCCANFMVEIGSSLVVNDSIGPSEGRTVSDGTYHTMGGVVAITQSDGLRWVFTEVR